MAQTTVQVNDPQSAQAWSRRLIVEALKATIVDKFVGGDENHVVQTRDETKSGGAKVTYGLRLQLAGAGTIGDNTLEGREEALQRHTDSMIIDQLRHAVLVVGNMSQQRVLFDLRSEAKSGLVDWLSNRIDVWLLNQLAGNTNAEAAGTDAEYAFTGLQACTAPDTDHWIASNLGESGEAKWLAGSSTAEDNLNAGSNPAATNAYFDLELIDACVHKARTLSPAIRPIMIKGQKCYVMFLHPNQVLQLRARTGSRWEGIQRDALAGGQITGNPIFNGAIGYYNGVVLHEDARVPFGDSTGINAQYGTDLGTNRANVARAIFCGAQSAFLSFGRQSGWPLKVKWFEELMDYGNQFGVSLSFIAGLKKVRFNSKDFGTIVVSTRSPGTVNN